MSAASGQLEPTPAGSDPVRRGMRPGEAAGGQLSYGVLIIVATALALTLIDAALLQLKRHYLSGGFLAGAALQGGGQVAGFLLGSLALDLWAITTGWLIALASRLGCTLAPLRRLALLGMVGLTAPLLYTVYRYELTRYLGDLADLDLLLRVAAGWPLELLAQGSSHLLPLLATLGGALMGGGLLIRALRRTSPSFPLSIPSTQLLMRLLLATSLVATTLLLALDRLQSPIAYGLQRKASGVALAWVVQHLSDVDRDGFGLLSHPPDPAPFDAGIHPYALEIPGNGVDENGAGGDLPAALAPRPEGPRAAWLWRPHVILVYLESFRADLLGARLGPDGPEITPVLSMLAGDGAHSEHAFVHTPYTYLSRAQLFGGKIVPRAGQPTLIDDFKANGYRVVYLSAQNEELADTRALVGFDRADVFYDARQDVDQRVSRFTTATSLAVSWKRLNQRALAMLESHDFERPLFLYVSYHDTHFPYHHAELDNLLGVKPLPRHRIAPERRAELFATYANAAANVDRAVGQLLAALERHVDRSEYAILVTADHGEALFEDGFLGHGQSLDPAQTRVPLIVRGLRGVWPEPIGAADLRGLLGAQLASPHGADPPLRFEPDPARSILQLTGSSREPRQVALRGRGGALLYDWLEGEASSQGQPPDEPASAPIWAFEAERLRSR